MTTTIFLCGLYSLAFAIFHIGFWKIFKWESDLKKLSFANKGIMQILNVQLIFYFLFTAFVCFAFPTELLNTKIGSTFLVANSFFWLIRLIQQFIFLRANHKAIHILTILFALPFLTK